MQVWDRGPRLCAIVTAEVDGRDATDLMHRLRAAEINTSAAIERGRLEGPVLRISPHYYNTPEEIDAAVAAMEELLRSGTGRR